MMTASESRTLGVHVGDLFGLDETLIQAAERRRITIDSRYAPKPPFLRDVLLLADATFERGKVYCIVGIVRDAQPTPKGKTLRFAALERFPVPIIVSRDFDEARRDDLVGTVSGWTPTGYHYLPSHAAEQACEEARLLAQPFRRVSAPPVATPSVPAEMPASVGMHRIYLMCTGGEGAGDSIITYLPLDADRRLLAAAPRPWFVRAVFSGNNWHGELLAEQGKMNRISWDIDAEPDSLTDLATVPVRVGAPVRLHLSDTVESEQRTYVIRSVQRV